MHLYIDLEFLRILFPFLSPFNYFLINVFTQLSKSKPFLVHKRFIQVFIQDCGEMQFGSLMSKQPRRRVRIGTGNTVGTCTSNVFDELEKFQARYEASPKKTKGSDVQREQRTSTIQAIKAISHWLYWKAPWADASAQDIQDLTPFRHELSDPRIKKIRDVAAARKQAKDTIRFLPKVSSKHLSYDEYWEPSNNAVPSSNRINSSSSEIASESTLTAETEVFEEEISSSTENTQRNPLLWFVPMGFATVAAVVVRSQLGEAKTGTAVDEHIVDSLIRDVVNSSWSQVILAGVTWCLIGMYIVELVVVVHSKIGKDRK